MIARIQDERSFVHDFIERIIRECPRRQPTSEDERRASSIARETFEQLGLETWEEGFEFNDNLYKNIALHFGLGNLGTAVSGVAPHLALPLHLLAGGSYQLDSTRRAYLLRRLLGFKPSQNVLARLPAEGEPRLRIVINAHVDAAFTGLIFDPRLGKLFGKAPAGGALKFLERPLSFVTKTQYALAGFDLLRMLFGPLTLPLRPLEYLLNIPGFLAFAATAEITLRDEIVPGANDDLSAVAALPVLAARLAAKKPPEVELLFVATGCEEASMGGADALVKSRKGEWAEQTTVGLSLEMLGNGQLCYFEDEGEVVPVPTPAWLVEAIDQVSASEPRFNGVRGFKVPVGGTDAAAFLYGGYDAIGILRAEPDSVSAPNYHQPTDTLDNIDLDQLVESIDFAEALVLKMIEMRLG